MTDIGAQLREHGIHVKRTAPGRYYTTCPQCSAQRKGAHKRLEVLGVTIENDGANWGCNHCGWTGAAKARGNGANGSARANLITYDYVDEHGTLLFQKVRFPNKEFRQRKPDGKGGWAWKLGNTRKVTYRLPEVNEAIGLGHSVCVVEGEKDVDNLWRIGLPATCNPDGAAKPGQRSKWRAEYSDLLRGADLVVMTDNDDAGRAHAEATAKACDGVAASVRMLDIAKHWPQCPNGGDVSDWLAAGGTREALDALIEQAIEYGKSETERTVLIMPEFLASYIRPDYLVDGLLQRSFFYSLTGNTGDGKTAIALLLAVYVAMGGQTLGSHAIEQGRVLYIAKENSTDIRQRLIGMASKIGFDPERIGSEFLVVEHLDSLEKDMPRIAKEIEAFGPVALVVIDTSAATFPGDDENNNPQMLAHAKAQRRLCDLPGRPCVLALCHPPKNATAKEQLVPRGGGGYLNETDGNLTAFGHGDKLSDLHWTGKLRGPDFEKVTFRFSTIYTNELADTKGRLLPTVMAEVVTDQEEAESEAKALWQENRLLAAMVAVPHGSFTDWARHCEWFLQAQPGEERKPHKSLLHRVMGRLIDAKLVKKKGRGYVLTPEGLEAAKAATGTPAGSPASDDEGAA